MQTRTKKWKRYRKMIQNLPDDKFPPDSVQSFRNQGVDDSILMSEATSSGSLTLHSTPFAKRNTKYRQYLAKKNAIIWIKCGVTILLIVLFVLVYFLWVKGV